MESERKVEHLTTGTGRLSWLTTQRTMLIVTVVSILLFVVLNTIDDISGSVALKNAALGLVASLLGAGVVGLLWEYGSKRSFTLEMQQSFTSMMDTLSRRAAVASAAENEGLAGVVTDFHYGVPWREYIRDCREIDVCWWAGETWLNQNVSILREQAENAGLKIRYLLPDVGDKILLEQMQRDSGLSVERLRSAYQEVLGILDSVGDGVQVVAMKTVPRFAMVRLGWRVAFFPYALAPGRNQDRPTFILDVRKPLGRIMMDDFERAWQLANGSES